MGGLERTWTELVLSSFAGADAGLTVRPDEVDYAASTQRFLSAASDKARLGLRVGLFLAVTAPVWMWGRLGGLGSLPPEERSRLLDEMLRHRVFFVRELCLLLKLVACFAIFRSSAVRARSGFDRPDVAVGGAADKRALTVLRPEAA